MTSRGSGRAAGVCAVIVTHNPALPRLKDALLAVTQQVGQVVIVDNCSHATIGEWLAARSAADVGEVLRMDPNVGIAAAPGTFPHDDTRHGARAQEPCGQTGLTQR